MREVVKISKPHSQQVIYVGRPTFLGNRWHIGPDGTREVVIARYRRWFARNWRDESFRNAVIQFCGSPGTPLGCHCAPQACHADVIAEFLATVE